MGGMGCRLIWALLLFVVVCKLGAADNGVAGDGDGSKNLGRPISRTSRATSEQKLGKRKSTKTKKHKKPIGRNKSKPTRSSKNSSGRTKKKKDGQKKKRKETKKSGNKKKKKKKKKKGKKKKKKKKKKKS